MRVLEISVINCVSIQRGQHIYSWMSQDFNKIIFGISKILLYILFSKYRFSKLYFEIVSLYIYIDNEILKIYYINYFKITVTVITSTFPLFFSLFAYYFHD